MPAARPLSHRLCHQPLQHRQEAVAVLLALLAAALLARPVVALLVHLVAALLVHLAAVPQAAARRPPVVVQLPHQAQKQAPVLLTIRTVVHFKDLLAVVAVAAVVAGAVVAVVEGDLAPVVGEGQAQAQVVADRHQVVEVAAVAPVALQAVPVVVVQAALQEAPAAVALLVVVAVGVELGVELGVQEEGCLVPVEGPLLTTLCQPLIIPAFVLYVSTTYWGFLFIPTKDHQDTMVITNLSLDLVIVLMAPAILPIATNLTSYQVNDTTRHFTRHNIVYTNLSNRTPSFFSQVLCYFLVLICKRSFSLLLRCKSLVISMTWCLMPALLLFRSPMDRYVD